MAYPDFGRHYPKNMFQLFKSGFAFYFAPEKEWYADKSDRTWNIFLPILGNWNKRHQQLMKTFLLLLDESMSGWRHVGLGVHGNFLHVCAGNHLSKMKMAMVPPILFFWGTLHFRHAYGYAERNRENRNRRHRVVLFFWLVWWH
jgi:hypothetical protein